MPRKNCDDIKLTAEQRTVVDALCEHDLYTPGTSGADVLLGCRKCSAAATRPATGRVSEIRWDDEATPSVTLVRVLSGHDQEGGSHDGPEDWVDPSETSIITSERIQREYGIGIGKGKTPIDFEALHSDSTDVASAALIESNQAFCQLVDWIEGLDRARTYHDLIEYRDRVFDIGDFGLAFEVADDDQWETLRSLVEQTCYEDENGVRAVSSDDVDALPKSHDAYKAAFYLALQSCIDAEWECETDGYFRFFDHTSERLWVDLDDKIEAAKFTEEWATVGFYIYDHSGISLSRGRVCAWDSSFAGYVCEKVREGETLAEAEQRASDLLSAMDAHCRGCYTQHTVQTAKVYRPSDLDDLDWEDGDSCGGCLYTEWRERDDPAEEALAAEVSALEKDGVTVINLGVVHVD